jgi:hypothetical protein
MEKKIGTKKCPYCSVVLGIDDSACFSCKRKVGPSNKHGIAEKPFDWMGYATTILSIAAFIYFIWWAFLKK